MRLSELAAGFPITPANADPDITGITEDSRRMGDGMLFVAVAGTSLDGHAYIAEAVARGAAAIVAERTGAIPPGVPIVRVPSSRAALAVLASRHAGTTAEKPSIIGFTGTFGKTSTSEILRSLLDAGGVRAGVIGSLGARYGAFSQGSNGLTTPAPVELHRMLRDLQAAGADTIIMEVTSHALRLRRVDGLRFAGGLLAAIMPGEHTDFHRSYENYVEAKRLFVAHLEADAVLAYDADNFAARRIAAGAPVKQTIGFSLDGRDADVMFDNVVLDGNGATFTLGGRLAGADSGVRLQSALLGRGHLRNVALALAYALGTGIPLDRARGVLPMLTPLRRRMERYEIAGRTVLDDTAAHPDSFRATFEVASLLPHNAMAVVYAVRGHRGVDINRRNALALADISSMYGVEPLIVTASADAVGSSDSASAAEIDAARQALVGRGRRFVWHDPLEGALRDALDRTLAGDLIVLAGAQGMDRGKEILFGAYGHRPSAAGA
jgi:UDP-N-acetylmuramoyl-L-alanyl-D-glutamate--2,6-diaminopimelate ligase